jgi:hypothetical protein
MISARITDGTRYLFLRNDVDKTSWRKSQFKRRIKRIAKMILGQGERFQIQNSEVRTSREGVKGHSED